MKSALFSLLACCGALAAPSLAAHTLTFDAVVTEVWDLDELAEEYGSDTLYASLPPVGAAATITIEIPDDPSLRVGDVARGGRNPLADVTVRLDIAGYLASGISLNYYPAMLTDTEFRVSSEGGSRLEDPGPETADNFFHTMSDSGGINAFRALFPSQGRAPGTLGDLLDALSGPNVQGTFDADLGGYPAPFYVTASFSAPMPAPVPLPAGVVLVATGLGILVLVGRRRSLNTA